MPTQAYYHFDVRFAPDATHGEPLVRDLVAKHGFTVANFSYRLDGEGRVRRYTTTIASTDRSAAGRLAGTLDQHEDVHEYRIAPTSD